MHPRSLVAIALVMTSCGGEGGKLPPAYNKENTRSFEVNLAHDLGPIMVLGGLDGDTTSPLLTSKNQTVVIREARVPADCSTTMDVTFPNAAAPAGDAKNYVFQPVDDLSKSLWTNAVTAVFKLVFDVGKGGCGMKDGIATGAPIAKPAVWIQASMNLLKHLLSIGTPPGWVEVFSDPFGAGGYGQGQAGDLVDMYSAFRNEFVKTFPESATNKRPFRLLAPSVTLASPADLAGADAPLQRFITAFKTAPPDGLSVRTAGEWPEDNEALLRLARKTLDDAGLKHLALADVGTRISDAGWTKIAGAARTREARSAYLGAHLVATRMLAQEEADLMVADRWGGPRTGASALAGEDLFFEADGTGLPAFLAFFPLYLMAYDEAHRVAAKCVETGGAGDGEGLVAIAASSGKAFQIVVAAANPGRIGKLLTYQIAIAGVPAGVSRLRLSRAVVDAASKAFAYSEIATLPVSKGKAFLQRTIDVPSVHYLLFETVTQGGEDTSSDWN